MSIGHIGTTIGHSKQLLDIIIFYWTYESKYNTGKLVIQLKQTLKRKRRLLLKLI